MTSPTRGYASIYQPHNQHCGWWSSATTETEQPNLSATRSVAGNKLQTKRCLGDEATTAAHGLASILSTLKPREVQDKTTTRRTRRYAAVGPRDGRFRRHTQASPLEGNSTYALRRKLNYRSVANCANRELSSSSVRPAPCGPG